MNAETKTRWEKMSKSRGNVVTIDEVVYGVADLDPAYEFRDIQGNVIDYREMGIWRDRAGDSMYYTGTPFGRQPVFLCQKGNPDPCILLIGGKQVVQHALCEPDEAMSFFRSRRLAQPAEARDANG